MHFTLTRQHDLGSINGFQESVSYDFCHKRCHVTRKTAGSAVVLALAGLLLCWQARAQEEPTAPGSDVPAAEAAPAAPDSALVPL